MIANENSQIALSNDPVFNKADYSKHTTLLEIWWVSGLIENTTDNVQL